MAIERDQRITQPAARFFEEYERALEVLRAEISFHTGDQAEAHHAALWLLSKLFFLCFLQCRRWPDGNPHFLTRFWHRYRRSGCDKDSFVGVWLDRLLAKTGGTYEFLDLRDRPRIPVTLQDLLEHVPALGSGLFLDGPCSQLDPRAVSDASFEQVLGVLDKFNYTLQDEFAPHQDLAVDPGMVGAAYERLVNLSQVEDQQPHSGVFFTPRVEIDLMCRLSLVDWLANHLGEDHKPLLYEVVFASDANRQERADTALAEQDLTSPLCDLLESVTVVDPACGSGSFLVGMLNVLEDLWARADTRHGSRKASADRKLEIVARNLFGVDVMPLAVEISRMRLWLQLYAAASKDLLQSGSNASLPNLSLRIRCGDSLVPQLEGVELTLGRSRELIPTDWAGRIARWSREKDLFFQNDPRCSYRGVAQILNAERTILFDLVDLRMKAIEQMGQSRGQTRQTGLQQARGAQRVLYSAEVAPFAWDSAFIEVFGQGRKGFDLVIGNPPYLRQELIDDPRRPVGRERSAGVRIYKDQLARTVYSVWPATFGYDLRDARARR